MDNVDVRRVRVISVISLLMIELGKHLFSKVSRWVALFSPPLFEVYRSVALSSNLALHEMQIMGREKPFLEGPSAVI
jgi:hypothetical protein